MDDKEARETIADRFADHEEVLRAAREAVRKTLAEHRRHGREVVVWRDGRPVRVVPEEEDPPK